MYVWYTTKYMKPLKIALIFIFMSIAIVAYYIFPTHKQIQKITLSQYIKRITITPITITPTIVKNHFVVKTLFVPYWTISKEKIDDSGYDQLVYFGITVNKEGIDIKEQGDTTIDQFLALTNPQKKRLLAVRMINSDINTQILHDATLQQSIITQAIKIAKQKGFDGIVLDFEISAIGFVNVTNEISNFETQFAKSVKQQHLQFFATLYGDTFYRVRPFDVKSIASASDGIMIMAYDFHKANGEPGPNFQLHDVLGDGYDFTTMTYDFLEQVAPTKITVIFGLFGYDWTIDAKGDSTHQAVSLSENQIKQKFLGICLYTDCRIELDTTSAETNVLYTDSEGNSHHVWFDDMNSVAKKLDYLQSKGIYSIAYWAYSYF